MCFHSKQSKGAPTLAKRFKAKLKTDNPVQSEHYNGFEHPQTPVIAHNDTDTIQLFQWGLIPAWAKDSSIRQYTLNAKVETLSEKPSFKNNIHRRCLVLADGFMEWQWLDLKGKNKQQYLITLPHQELFAFAGIWSEWLDPATGELTNTYSILTTEAKGLMAEIHNSKKRMPIILRPEQEKSWLEGHNYQDFSHPDIELKAEKVQQIQGTLF